MSTFSGKRLARNTLLMYFRLGISVVVSFITTRVVFNTLGVDNYGLYGVVAGIIVLFSFVSQALATSAQRFYSYELGKENYEKLEKIYNALLRIFFIISILVFILAETVGLWFLNYKMTFPDGKIGLANFVYQISIVTTIVQIFRVPYDAAILSSEQFDFYAYTSIINAFLQLGVVFLLGLLPTDSTKSYVVLLLIVAIIMLCWYILYCKRNIPFIRLSRIIDKKVFKELFTFSGWSFFGALCNMGYRQGVNVVINVFFGVALNAAYGIANQVSALVNQFVAGFQSAYNPQITKTCSIGTPEEQTKLVSLASKITFSLLLVIGICAILNVDLLLDIWLGEVPEKTHILCTLMIIAAIVDSISDPLWIVIFASGDIKKYQLTCAGLMIGNVLLTILAFTIGCGVEISMYIRIAMNIGVLLVRLIITYKQTQIAVSRLVKGVILKGFLVIVIIIPMIGLTINLSKGYCRLFLSTPLILIIISSLLLFILFDRNERVSVRQLVSNRLLH